MRLWCPRVINHRTVTERLADKMKKKKRQHVRKSINSRSWSGQSSRLVKVHCLQKDKSRLNWISFSSLSLWERPISFLTSIYVNELSWVGPRLIPSGNVCKCYLERPTKHSYLCPLSYWELKLNVPPIDFFGPTLFDWKSWLLSHYLITWLYFSYIVYRWKIALRCKWTKK